MILITSNAVINNVLCVCKDESTALDYLRTIIKKPLTACNYEIGVAKSFRHESEGNFSDCELNPCNWKYIDGSIIYYLQPVDYID